MEGQEAFGLPSNFLIIILIAILVFAWLFAPMFETVLEMINPYSQYWSESQEELYKIYFPATFLSPYFEAAPKTEEGLLEEPCYVEQGRYNCATWFNAARNEFRLSYGEQFVQALIDYQLAERPFCQPLDKCVKLKNCVENKEKMFDKSWGELTDTEKRETNSIIVDCLQIASYFIEREKFMIEHSTGTEGELTSAWTREIP